MLHFRALIFLENHLYKSRIGFNNFHPALPLTWFANDGEMQLVLDIQHWKILTLIFIILILIFIILILILPGLGYPALENINSNKESEL